MKLTSDWSPVLDHIHASGRAAAEDTFQDIHAKLPRLTGELAAKTHLVELRARGSGVRFAITSDAIHADAVERGANTRAKASVKAGTKRRRSKGVTCAGPVFNRGTRRGPHMEGSHVIRDNGPRFIDHMTDRLRSGR